MPIITPSLQDIVRERDAKIMACLAGKRPTHFCYAHCAMDGTHAERMQRLYALDFDNYPAAQIPGVDVLRPYMFFFERIVGAEVVCLDGNPGDFFHCWCRPLLVRKMSKNGDWLGCPPRLVPRSQDGEGGSGNAVVVDSNVDIRACPHFSTSFVPAVLESSPLLHDYEEAIRVYLRDTPKAERLPVVFPGLSPLDMACNLCGAESFFLLLYDEPAAAAHLLDTIATLMVEVYRRLQRLGARLVSPYGFPGVYINDLQLPYLSPAHIARFMLPCYSRIAEECGGLLLAFLTPDREVVQSALRMNGVMGYLFDRALPLSTIKAHLGEKLFLIPHYCFDDALDRPTFRNGVGWNPIVQSYSRELPQLYREFADTHNLLITIERPTLKEVCAVRQALFG